MRHVPSPSTDIRCRPSRGSFRDLFYSLPRPTACAVGEMMAVRISSYENIPRIVRNPVFVEKRHNLLDKANFPVVLLLIPNVALYLPHLRHTHAERRISRPATRSAADPPNDPLPSRKNSL